MPRTTSKKAFAHKGAHNTTAAHARKKSPARKKPGATKKRVKRTLSPRGRKKTKEAGASKAATKKSGVKKTGAKGTGVRNAAASEASARKYSPKASARVGAELHEMKAGKLRSGGSGKKVTNRKQAIAIGLSEARRSGAKVRPKKR